MGKSGEPIAALNARRGQPLQLDFRDGTLPISNTCNRMHGAYTLATGTPPNHATLEVGPLATTLMLSCPDHAPEAMEHAAQRYLHGALAFATDASEASPQLILTTAAGDKLVFTGVPTPETRYGSKGATEFLEIAPEPQPCDHPGMPHARCLAAREVHYNAQGLRTGTPGAWQVLSQPMEGFTHEPGVRNVLRVTRYEVPNPPADAPSRVHVLDVVVESRGARASH